MHRPCRSASTHAHDAVTSRRYGLTSSITLDAAMSMSTSGGVEDSPDAIRSRIDPGPQCRTRGRWVRHVHFVDFGGPGARSQRPTSRTLGCGQCTLKQTGQYFARKALQPTDRRLSRRMVSQLLESYGYSHCRCVCRDNEASAELLRAVMLPLEWTNRRSDQAFLVYYAPLRNTLWLT